MAHPIVELNDDEDMVVTALINDEYLYEMCSAPAYSLFAFTGRIEMLLELWEEEIAALAGHDVEMDNVDPDVIAEWFWYEENE